MTRKQVAEIEALKVAIFEAIAIIDNDLYVSRAANARDVLAEALEVHGYPDEDSLANQDEYA